MNNGREHWLGLLLIACSIVLSAGAQLLMKAGMLELGGIDLTGILSSASPGIPLLLPALAWVVAGLCLYATSLVFWLAALARCELSLAYPLLSLSYVLVYMGAVAWPRLHETISLPKTTGILLILAGVFLLTRRTNGRPG